MTTAKTAKPRPRVYIAASGDDIDRAKEVRRVMRDAGVDVLASWIHNVEAVGDSNPRTASKNDRKRWSINDLTEVSAADLLLVLVPPPGKTSRGLWFEGGFSYCAGKPIIFSGDTLQSIFCALGDEFETDAEAMAEVFSHFGLGVAEGLYA